MPPVVPTTSIFRAFALGWRAGAGRSYLVFASILALALSIAPLPSAASTAVGATKGAFSVNDNGAASYVVPIEVPPGTAGMEPEISLTYSSHGGNGLMGVGWSLSGLSAIQRCGATYAQDGFSDGVDLERDRYCLDGQRLIAVVGNPGAAGSEYRLEVDSITKVTFDGTSFTAQTKAGLTIQYGATDPSRLTSATNETYYWAVNRITDNVGNYLTVSYTKSTTGTAAGRHRPSRIDYTGNDGEGLAPYASVRFVYGTQGGALDDVRSGYALGKPTLVDQWLTAVRTFVGETKVREYRIHYQISPATGRSRIDSVTECEGAAINPQCLEPLTFDWTGQTALPSFEDYRSPPPIAATQIDENGLVRFGDWNGDGFQDMVWIKSDGRNQWYVNDGVGGFSETSMVLEPVYLFGTNSLYVGDWNGDGYSDLLWYQPGNGRTDLYLNRTQSAGQLDFQRRANPLPSNLVDADGGRLFVLDWNGDGLQDLLFWEAPHGRNHWFKNTWSPGSSTVAFAQEDRLLTRILINYAEIDGSGTDLLVEDWSGDGQPDVLWYNPSNGANRLYVSTYEDGALSFEFAGAPMTAANVASSTGGLEVGDWNGDGLKDLLWRDRDGANTWYLNKGDAHFEEKSTLIDSDLLDTTTVTTGGWGTRVITVTAGVVILDANHDGLDDLLWHDHKTGENRWFINQDHWHAGAVAPYFSKIDNLITPGDIASSDNLGDIYQGDWNGDGLLDLLWYNRSNGANHWFENAGTFPDLLSGVSDGLGAVTGITYKPATDASVYGRSATVQFPNILMRGPLPLVSDVATTGESDSGTYTTSYYYQDGLLNLQGRGFQGFGYQDVTDSRTGIQTQTYREQNLGFPYNGLTTLSQSFAPDGTRLSMSMQTHNQITSFGDRVHFVYLSDQEDRSYELDGQLVTLTTTQSWYDTYGNATRLLVRTSTGGLESFVQDTHNTYMDDVANWRLGRLTRAEVMHASPSDTQTRVSTFGYDNDTGQLDHETVEPDDPALRVDTAYTLDGFGNRTAVALTAAGQTRTTTTVYDAQGRFPVEVRNALNQKETRAYDSRFGTLTRLTGPNDLTTEWQYDGFGRKVLEHRADGTETTVDFAWCSTPGLCPIDAVYRVLTQSTGSAPEYVYFDHLGRELRKETVGLGVRAVYVDTEYDDKGRVARTSKPYYQGDEDNIYWTSFTYDLLGRVEVQTLPDLSTVSTTYAGLTTTVTNDLGQIATTVKDALGRVVRTEDTRGNAVVKTYDAVGNLLTITDPAGNVTTLTYDGAGRKVSMDDPDMGYGTYDYNALGELVSQTDARGQTQVLTYDLLGRLVQRDEPEGLTTWTYDTALHGIGKLAEVETYDGVRKSYTYDALGRPESTRVTVDALNYDLDYGYDAVGRLDTQTYPSGEVVRRVYDANGYLTALEDGASNAAYWSVVEADAAGRVTAEAFGNGITSVRVLNPATDRPEQILTGPAGGDGSVQRLSYDYDTLGNLRFREDLNQGLVETFDYDDLNRLISATIAGGAVKTYQYDTIGNITDKSDVGIYTYGQNAGPHAVTQAGSIGYTYDANGNQTAGDGRGITYTSFNQPQRITRGIDSADFVYDAERQRIKQTALMDNKSEVTLYIDASYEVVKKNLLTTIQRHYLMVGGRRVAMKEVEPALIGAPVTRTRYLHGDHLGSTDAITDETGAVVERLSYDPHGKRRFANTWSDDPTEQLRSQVTDRGFTGHEHLDALGLVNMNGRLYDPTLGRFLSADPFVQFPDYTQGLNRYSYGLNNPLKYTDPSGYNIFSEIREGLTAPFKNPVFRAAVAIAVAYVMGPVGPWHLFSTSGTLTATEAAIANSLVAGFSSGLITSGGDFKTAGISALTAVAFYGVGHGLGLDPDAPFLSPDHVKKIILHGVVAGASSRLQGGQFRSGFLAGSFTQFAAPGIGASGNRGVRVVAAAVVGGTASRLGGGKFANGAVTGSFSRLFNDELPQEIRDELTPANHEPLSPEFAEYLSPLEDAALRAYQEVGDWGGLKPAWLRGIQVHAVFARYVREIGGKYHAEVSYYDHLPVRYGTLGSVRADAIYGDISNPMFAVDLKTGNAYITRAAFRRYQDNLPAHTPVLELSIR